MSINNIENNFRFFIYNENLSCIYNLESNQNNLDIGAIQAIIQVLFYSACDSKCDIRSMSSDLGILTYKSFTYKDTSLLFALVLPNYYGDEETAGLLSERVIDFLYNCLIVHLGAIDLHMTTNADLLRRYITMYEMPLRNILNNQNKLSFLLKAEKKIGVHPELLYSLKHYCDKFKTQLKLDVLCLMIQSNVAWASSEWNKLDINDRLLFLSLADSYCSDDINEIPVYFSKTQVEDDLSKHSSISLIGINLIKDCKLIFLSSAVADLNKILEGLHVFDEFFISRVSTFSPFISSGNEIVDNSAESIVVYNNQTKTYKSMISQKFESVISDFLLNSHFTNVILKKSSNCDEFYLKDDHHIFYYYKLGSLTFLMLFDNETTFDDINATKLTLKTLRENYDHEG